MIIKIAEGNLKTKFGEYREYLYYDGLKESIALVMSEVANAEDVLCRVHSSCIFAHVFNSIECDCHEQMEISQQLINEAGRGEIQDRKRPRRRRTRRNLRNKLRF